MRRLELWLAAAALALLALGAALVPVQLPWFTRAMVTRVSELPQQRAMTLGEQARSFVTSGDETARIALERAMTPDAVAHLDDVRRVMAAANLTVAGLGLALVAWGSGRARHDPALAAGALGRAAALLGGGVSLAVAIALVDFDTFFSAFHGLFFAEGTWIFPSDSVLIQLFPEPFWQAAGVVWAGFLVAFTLVYALSGAMVSRNLSSRA